MNAKAWEVLLNYDSELNTLEGVLVASYKLVKLGKNGGPH